MSIKSSSKQFRQFFSIISLNFSSQLSGQKSKHCEDTLCMVLLIAQDQRLSSKFSSNAPTAQRQLSNHLKAIFLYKTMKKYQKTLTKGSRGEFIYIFSYAKLQIGWPSNNVSFRFLHKVRLQMMLLAMIQNDLVLSLGLFASQQNTSQRRSGRQQFQRNCELFSLSLYMISSVSSKALSCVFLLEALISQLICRALLNLRELMRNSNFSKMQIKEFRAKQQASSCFLSIKQRQNAMKTFFSEVSIVRMLAPFALRCKFASQKVDSSEIQLLMISIRFSQLSMARQSWSNCMILVNCVPSPIDLRFVRTILLLLLSIFFKIFSNSSKILWFQTRQISICLLTKISHMLEMSFRQQSSLNSLQFINENIWKNFKMSYHCYQRDNLFLQTSPQEHYQFSMMYFNILHIQLDFMMRQAETSKVLAFNSLQSSLKIRSISSQFQHSMLLSMLMILCMTNPPNCEECIESTYAQKFNGSSNSILFSLKIESSCFLLMSRLNYSLLFYIIYHNQYINPLKSQHQSSPQQAQTCTHSQAAKILEA